MILFLSLILVLNAGPKKTNQVTESCPINEEYTSFQKGKYLLNLSHEQVQSTEASKLSLKLFKLAKIQEENLLSLEKEGKEIDSHYSFWFILSRDEASNYFILPHAATHTIFALNYNTVKNRKLVEVVNSDGKLEQRINLDKLAEVYFQDYELRGEFIHKGIIQMIRLVDDIDKTTGNTKDKSESLVKTQEVNKSSDSELEGIEIIMRYKGYRCKFSHIMNNDDFKYQMISLYNLHKFSDEENSEINNKLAEVRRDFEKKGYENIDPDLLEAAIFFKAREIVENSTEQYKDFSKSAKTNETESQELTVDIPKPLELSLSDTCQVSDTNISKSFDFKPLTTLGILNSHDVLTTTVDEVITQLNMSPESIERFQEKSKCYTHQDKAMYFILNKADIENKIKLPEEATDVVFKMNFGEARKLKISRDLYVGENRVDWSTFFKLLSDDDIVFKERVNFQVIRVSGRPSEIKEDASRVENEAASSKLSLADRHEPESSASDVGVLASGLMNLQVTKYDPIFAFRKKAAIDSYSSDLLSRLSMSEDAISVLKNWMTTQENKENIIKRLKKGISINFGQKDKGDIGIYSLIVRGVLNNLCEESKDYPFFQNAITIIIHVVKSIYYNSNFNEESKEYKPLSDLPYIKEEQSMFLDQRHRAWHHKMIANVLLEFDILRDSYSDKSLYDALINHAKGFYINDFSMFGKLSKYIQEVYYEDENKYYTNGFINDKKFKAIVNKGMKANRHIINGSEAIMPVYAALYERAYLSILDDKLKQYSLWKYIIHNLLLTKSDESFTEIESFRVQLSGMLYLCNKNQSVYYTNVALSYQYALMALSQI